MRSRSPADQRRHQSSRRGLVEPGGGLVEDQDAARAQQRAGDGEPLPLSAGEAAAALADAGVVAAGQALDEVVRVGGARGGADLGAGGVGAAEHEVVVDARVHHQLLLVDDGDRVAHRRRRVVGDVVAVDGDDPGVGGELAGEQPAQRRLAGAARSDEGDDLAGGDVEGQVGQRHVPAPRDR